jgi:hypothetical protein
MTDSDLSSKYVLQTVGFDGKSLLTSRLKPLLSTVHSPFP